MTGRRKIKNIGRLSVVMKADGTVRFPNREGKKGKIEAIRMWLRSMIERWRDNQAADELNILYAMLHKERGDFTREDGAKIRAVGKFPWVTKAVICTERYNARHPA